MTISCSYSLAESSASRLIRRYDFLFQGKSAETVRFPSGLHKPLELWACWCTDGADINLISFLFLSVKTVNPFRFEVHYCGLIKSGFMLLLTSAVIKFCLTVRIQTDSFSSWQAFIFTHVSETMRTYNNRGHKVDSTYGSSLSQP